MSAANPAKVVQDTAAAYKAAEDAIAAALEALSTLEAVTARSALPAVRPALAPTPVLAGRRHLARLQQARGALGEAMAHVGDAHAQIERWRDEARLPPVVTPRDAGGGK